MKIFNTEPNTWKELQDFVGQMFRECNFVVDVSKTIDLVRGRKEIDVYAQDNSNEYQLEILVECKYWNKPVHQETVHAFRTVINDFGPNVGYIISKKGFQSGCYEVVQKTNIKLITLEELEEIYHLRWRSEMAKKYIPFTNLLLPYWICSSPPNATTIDGYPIDFNTHVLLSHAYSPICDLALSDYFEKSFERYPYIIPLVSDELIIIGSLEIKNDREYFDFCEKNKEMALKHHKILFGETK